MKQQSSTILYLFIILIILSGLVLFIFKDNIANNFLNYNIDLTTTTKRPSSDLKLDILRDARIKELKQYVNIFDYNNLEKSQELILENYNLQSDVVISNPDDKETASSTDKTKAQFIRVRVGNSNPFLVKKKVKE